MEAEHEGEGEQYDDTHFTRRLQLVQQKELALLTNRRRQLCLIMEKQSLEKRGDIPIWLPAELILPHRVIAMQPGQSEKRDDRGTSPDKRASDKPGTENKEASAPKWQGRKRAPKPTRKTAHKLIEQRRREKMNKELELLKNKLPVSLDGAFKVEIIQVRLV